jgi:hypothetical protein
MYGIPAYFITRKLILNPRIGIYGKQPLIDEAPKYFL